MMHGYYHIHTQGRTLCLLSLTNKIQDYITSKGNQTIQEVSDGKWSTHVFWHDIEYNKSMCQDCLGIYLLTRRLR